MDFKQGEVLDLSQRVLKIALDDMENHSHLLRIALREAVDADILYECHNDDDTVGPSSDEKSYVDVKSLGSEGADGIDFVFGDVEYAFVHDTWRRVILSTLLSSYTHDMHRHAALGLEEVASKEDFVDFRTQVKVFGHWRDAEDKANASRLALEIGTNFKMLGMIHQSIEIYNETIHLWKKYDPPKGEDRIAGFSPVVLDSLDQENLICLVKLQTALGQAIGSIYSGDLSAASQAFRDALEVRSS